MGPIATLWSHAMCDRGYVVDVVSAHPHYPGPLWGHRLFPYREVHDGIRVTRLPLWIGRGGGSARVREEATYAACASVAAVVVGSADVYVVVSPSFSALAPLIVNAGVRRRPWVLWLQDILPDAATTTGLLRESRLVRAARRLELAAYRRAERIVVISDTFTENLRAKGVPEEKIVRIYNPATRGFADQPRRLEGTLRVLYVGNIGHSQGLERFVRAVERSTIDLKLVVIGTGERVGDVAREIRSPRVELRGLVDDAELDRELDAAHVALLTQRPDVVEFNVPSRLMTMTARGLPVVAAARERSEVRRLVEEFDAGWVFDAGDPDALCRRLADIVSQPDELGRRSAAALRLAHARFSPDAMMGAFVDVVESVARG
jgi:colanic acid biosynthesis glycosyl transferase WcaI